MYGSTSFEYTDVSVAREMEKDYFGPYLVTEIFRYCPFLGSKRSQRESKCGLGMVSKKRKKVNGIFH